MSAALLTPPYSAVTSVPTPVSTDAPTGDQFTTFVKTYHDYLRIRRHIGATAYFVLSVLQEHSHGYGQDTTRVPLSVRDIEDTLGLSENTVRVALRKLEHFQLVRSNAESVKRTQKRTWTLLPPCEWSCDLRALMSAHLTPVPVTPAPRRRRTSMVKGPINTTTAKIEGVTTEATQATAKIEVATPAVAAKIEGVVLTATAIFEGVTPPEAAMVQGAAERKESNLKEKVTKEEDGELTLSSAADATAAPTASPAASAPAPAKRQRSVKPPRELSPDHQYRVDLLAAIEAVNEGVKAPKRDAEWAAAGKFYHWSGGAPAIETVVACYEITRRAPAWDTAYLSLMTLVGAFGPYLRNPANYAAGIERKRAAAGGEYEAKRAQQSMRAAPVGRPAPTQPTTATVDGDLSDRDMARLTRYGPNNGRNGKGTRDNDTVTGPAGRTGTPAPDAHTTGLGRAAGPAGQPGDAPRAAGPHPRPVEDDRRSLPARSRSLGSSRTERTTRAGGWPDITELDPIGTGAYVPTDAEYHGAGTEDEPFFTAAARRQAERAKRLHGLHGAE